MAISLSARMQQDTSPSVSYYEGVNNVALSKAQGQALKHIAVRSAGLLLLGLLLSNGDPLKQWRLTGVLHYFAVSGLSVAALALLTGATTFALRKTEPCVSKFSHNPKHPITA